MNFNFNNQRSKLNIAPPIMRHFSTIGYVQTKPEQNDCILKPDYLFNKNVQTKFFSTFQGNVLPNKSFSNPNFVNKQNPNILFSVAGAFKLSKCHENLNSNCKLPPKHDNFTKKHCEETPLVYQPLPEKLSSQNKPEMPSASLCTEPKEIPSPKMPKKSKNRKKKQAKRQKQEKHQEQLCNMTKKNKNCPTMKIKRFKKPKKIGPWHKYDKEIMTLDESILMTSETPENDKFEESFRVERSSPVEISSKCNGIFAEAFTIAFSPCEILKNLSSSNEIMSCSPSSPVINRLRQSSECDSEDSFIVFCDDTNECLREEENGFSSDELTENEDSDSEDFSENESDFGIEDFQEKTELYKRRPQKKVTFATEDSLCTVHPMVQWGYAYQSARRGPWEQLARDRARFETRINNVANTLNVVLDPNHRERIYQERFQEV